MRVSHVTSTRFKRGPDEEGIETEIRSRDSELGQRSNADLMKKGLRLPPALSMWGCRRFKRGPDEEGIETSCNTLCALTITFKRGPDEEGIETPAVRISSHDFEHLFKRGPDEEGICT